MDKNNKTKNLDLEVLDSSTPLVEYYDGDVAIIDNISNLTTVAPIYANRMNFIILCLKGRIQFDINDTPLMLNEQQILLSAPHVLLDKFLFSPDFESKVLCLSDDIIHSMLGEQVNNWNISVHNQRTNVVSLPEEDQEQFVYYYELVRFKMRHKDRRNSTISMHSIIQAMLFDVLGLLDDRNGQAKEAGSPSHGKTLFNDFLRMLSDEPVKHRPVKYYAARLNVTEKYLSMLCSRYSNRPASSWITQFTREEIRYNLLHTDLTIKEVSDRVGFPNVSFFGTYVRRQFGVSPSKFRRQGLEQ